MLSMYLHYFAIILPLEKILPLICKKNNPKMSFIQECFVPSSVKILQVMQEKTFGFFF